MRTRAGFTERIEMISRTLGQVDGALCSVRASFESGALGVMMARALRLVQCVNGDEVTTRGFRLHALARLEDYVSADKNVSLVGFLAR